MLILVDSTYCYSEPNGPEKPINRIYFLSDKFYIFSVVFVYLLEQYLSRTRLPVYILPSLVSTVTDEDVSYIESLNSVFLNYILFIFKHFLEGAISLSFVDIYILYNHQRMGMTILIIMLRRILF